MMFQENITCSLNCSFLHHYVIKVMCFVISCRERQQQLEELTKELTRVQDEADNLRLKLKLIEKSRKVSFLAVYFTFWLFLASLTLINMPL